MTKGQYITFIIIARCCFAKYAVKVGLLGLNGDPIFKREKRKLILVNEWMKMLECYDPNASDNCFDSTDAQLLVNRISEYLGLCGDPLSLDESDATCCDPLNGVTIINS